MSQHHPQNSARLLDRPRTVAAFRNLCPWGWGGGRPGRPIGPNGNVRLGKVPRLQFAEFRPGPLEPEERDLPITGGALGYLSQFEGLLGFDPETLDHFGHCYVARFGGVDERDLGFVITQFVRKPQAGDGDPVGFESAKPLTPEAGIVPSAVRVLVEVRFDVRPSLSRR